MPRASSPGSGVRKAAAHQLAEDQACGLEDLSQYTGSLFKTPLVSSLRTCVLLLPRLRRL